MQEIVEKYSCNTTPYLLPIISSIVKDERTQYSSASAFTNRKLKEIQRLLELDTPLTMYVTRHSWASIAKTRIFLLQLSARVWGMIQRLLLKSIWLHCLQML